MSRDTKWAMEYDAWSTVIRNLKSLSAITEKDARSPQAFVSGSEGSALLGNIRRWGRARSKLEHHDLIQAAKQVLKLWGNLPGTAMVRDAKGENVGVALLKEIERVEGLE